MPLCKRENGHEDEKKGHNKRQKLSNTIPYHRGKFKLKYLVKHASLLRNSDPVHGVLVSCSPATETRALGQTRTFIEKQLAVLFPEAELCYPNLSQAEDVDLDYIDKEKECDTALDVSTSGEHTGNVNNDGGDQPVQVRQRGKFQSVDTGCAGLIFLRFRVNVGSVPCINKIFVSMRAMNADVAGKLIDSVSHCHRFMPIERTCSAATIEDIRDAFGPAIDTYLKNYAASVTNKDKAPTIAIVFEGRNNIVITKSKVVDALGPHIPSMFCVDLTSPDITIYVSVFKSVAGMSFLLDYSEYRKYNLQQYLTQSSS